MVGLLPPEEQLIADVLWEQDLYEVLIENIPRLRKLDNNCTPFISYNRLIPNEDGEEVEIREPRRNI